MWKFYKREAPEETIRRAMQEALYTNYLVTSITRIDALCSKASFNDDDNFGLLRNIAMKIPEMVSNAIYRGEPYYATLKQEIHDF